MDFYTINFVVALIAALAIVFLCVRSKKRRIVGFVFVSLVDFGLFYNLDYRWLSGVSPIVGCYAGAVFVAVFFVFLSSYKRILINQETAQPHRFSLILLFFSQYILFLYTRLIPWAIDTFPLSNVDAVLFTVFSGENEGAEDFVISNFIDSVLIPSFPLYAFIIVLQILTAFILFKRKFFVEFNLKRIKFILVSKNLIGYIIKLQKCTAVFLLIVCFILSSILPKIILSACFEVLFERPVDSELYKMHFVPPPDSIEINQSGKTKNLIVILMESMETNFSRYTPEISGLERENTNFVPGGVSVAGTSWTMGAITSKLCGIPLNMPMKMNEYNGKFPSYVPNARCLSDILSDKGCKQVFIQGSNGNFTQMRDFCSTHGNIILHDLTYFKSKGKIPSRYHVFWGMEDRKVYNYAKEDLDSLSKINFPFAYFISTMDTHQPEGFLDEICSKEIEGVEDLFPKVLRCASKQLGDFLIWMKQQPWYENTVISVMGDHTMPVLSAKAGVSPSDSLYWTNFIINSAVTTPVRERQYSSLDMFPTLLESMGFNLKNRSAGLGRSLYSDSLTMLELYGRKTLDSLLRERSIQYDKFLMKKNE
ncbi:MAG: LTA synthase family protein [Fibrobacter sp.]|nr:LTA synthase family protein [Fibrobacter sp.]